LPRDRRSPALAIIATIAAISPMLVTVVRYTGRHTVLWGDSAIIDVITRDVWTTHAPLTGFYSRVGFDYPGPISYYLIAPLSLITGHPAWALIVGYALLQAVAIAGTARIAWRQAHQLTLVLAVLAVDSLTYLGLRHFDPMVVPWNPYVVVPFFLLFAFQCWSIGLGHYRQIPWAVAVATFIVQTNVTYGLLVAFGAGWVLWTTFPRRATNTDPALWIRRVGIGALVGVVLWLPPIVEQLRHGRQGNLYKLGEFFVLGRRLPTLNPSDSLLGDPLGARGAAHLLATEFHLVPPWLGGSIEPTGSTLASLSTPLLWLAAPIVLLVASFVVARHHRNRPATHAVLLMAWLTVAGVVSMATVHSPPGLFDFFWRIPLAVMVVAATLGTLLTASRLWSYSWIRAATGVLLAIAIVAPAIVTSNKALDASPQILGTRRIVEQLMHQITPAECGGRQIQIRGEIGLVASLYNELERRGCDVSMSEKVADFRFQGRHGKALEDVDRVWIAVPSVDASRVTELPGADEIAAITHLSPKDDSRIRELQSSLSQQLVAAGKPELIPSLASPGVVQELGEVPGLDAASLRELAKLNVLGGWRYAIVSFDPATAPVELFD
jgi:hypothetical protein